MQALGSLECDLGNRREGWRSFLELDPLEIPCCRNSVSGLVVEIIQEHQMGGRSSTVDAAC